MNNIEFAEKISSFAIKSILCEVSASPKPGLVDRLNSGAHRDMDFFTFLSSSAVLSFYFYKCTLEGLDFKGKNYRDLLKIIRPLGLKAEEEMLAATGGVNTHKGIIFSQGIISASVGSLHGEGRVLSLENMIERIKEISQGISHELKNPKNKEKLTYGEKLFIRYGVKGIRGEAELGFPTVADYSYPVFKKLIACRENKINDVLVQTLLHLIENTQDSNILGRHDRDLLKFAQEKAGQAIKIGGIFTDAGRLFIEDMDISFIEKNISPGGAADLLSVTMMLYMIENGDII
nr:triphosphoribosyl-dephospho-CoA synthase CitG [Tissierella sp.]